MYSVKMRGTEVLVASRANKPFLERKCSSLHTFTQHFLALPSTTSRRFAGGSKGVPFFFLIAKAAPLFCSPSRNSECFLTLTFQDFVFSGEENSTLFIVDSFAHNAAIRSSFIEDITSMRCHISGCVSCCGRAGDCSLHI